MIMLNTKMMMMVMAKIAMMTFFNLSITTKVPDSVYSSVLKLCEQKKKEMEL